MVERAMSHLVGLPLPPRPADKLDAAEALAARVRAYHERSKHHLSGYAARPETLDWDSQPSAFRRFVGAPAVALPQLDEVDGALRFALELPFDSPFAGAALPFSLPALAVLLQLSLGITAWKSQGPDRWAVRANPSSGNLHPVEGYLVATGVVGLRAGVHHYRAEDHALECRASWDLPAVRSAPRVWIALSTVIWREAWKYGERAFRYNQLDTGHAIGAFAAAAAVLGWRVREQPQIGWETLLHTLGLDRSADFPHGSRPDTELEEPEVLLELSASTVQPPIRATELRRSSSSARYFGEATRIDPHPMYSWPVLEDVAQASRWPDDPARAPGADALGPAKTQPGLAESVRRSTQAVIAGRRSAQRFDSKFMLERSSFVRILSSLERVAPGPGAGRGASGIDLIVFVHRVEGLPPGVYFLRRSSDATSSLHARLAAAFELRHVPDALRDARSAELSAPLELFELARRPTKELARIARTVHCHQDIASNGCFAVGMLADFERSLDAGPAAYRELLREAGRLGHMLYLQSEAEGVRSTGIGCFFDDAVLELISLSRSPIRSLYHLSVGKAIEDPRVETVSAARAKTTTGAE
ncbi:MAG TPA: nitroreductase [Polyangiaceae bacterium]|nr:nitroreductase [Polyangiaceae bacterium]